MHLAKQNGCQNSSGRLQNTLIYVAPVFVCRRTGAEQTDAAGRVTHKSRAGQIHKGCLERDLLGPSRCVLKLCINRGEGKRSLKNINR